jgi:hypothetical protein
LPHSPATAIASPGDLNGDWDLAFSELFFFRPRILLPMVSENLGLLGSSTFQGGNDPFALTALGDATGDGVPELAGTTDLGSGRTVFLAQLGRASAPTSAPRPSTRRRAGPTRADRITISWWARGAC